MQRCAPIVTGEIGEEFIGECWTYNICVLTKLQLYKCFTQTSVFVCK